MKRKPTKAKRAPEPTPEKRLGDPINFKKATESSFVYRIMGAAFVSFVAGWGGYSVVQNATGRVSISAEQLRNLEERVKLGKESILKENELLLARIRELEKEKVTLTQRLLDNTPKGKSYAAKVLISPPSPAALNTDEEVTVTFDYVIADGINADLFVKNATPVEIEYMVDVPGASKKKARMVMITEASTTFTASTSRSGRGTESRTLSLKKTGEIKLIAIRMYDNKTNALLHEMEIPVQYTFK